MAGAGSWVKWNPNESDNDCPLGSVETYTPLCSIGKKVHSSDALKYCFRGPFFACSVALGYVIGTDLGSETFPTFCFFGGGPLSWASLIKQY